MRFTVTKKVSDDKVIITRHAERDRRELVYVNKLCVGCGICEQVCPHDAIALGPIGDIITQDRDDFLLSIDEEKCSLCGLCCAFCPKHAFDLTVNGLKFDELRGFVRLERKWLLKEDLCVPYDEEEKKVCTECEDVCPTKAVEVVEVKKGVYEVRHDDNLCCYCGKCAKACPIEGAIEVMGPFKGEISIDFDKCKKCDVCVTVCPVKVIQVVSPTKPYLKEERYKIEDEFCVFYGTCAQACPADAIQIKRGDIRLVGGLTEPWRERWMQAIEALKEVKTKRG